MTMETAPFRILLIEDDPDDSMLLRANLDESGANADILQITRLTGAAEAVQDHQFELVLLDLNLPDSRGLETLKHVLVLIPDTPIIVMSGTDHETLALQAIQHGAQDFLVKGKLQPREFARAILFALERYRRQNQLQQLSHQDSLTNLYNRRGFIVYGENILHQARRAGHELILYLVDLDRLKTINDTFGHLAGDRALSDASDLFRTVFRRSEVIARLGGDEFSILVKAPSQNASILLSRLDLYLRNFNARPDRDYDLSWCIGYAVYLPTSQDTLETLLAAADLELYKEKQKRSLAAGLEQNPQSLL